MHRKSANIAYALLDREHGINRIYPKAFKRIALELVEYSLLERLKNEDLCKPLDDLSNETESVFNVEQSHNGCYAATVQTNKSVNIFEVSSMKKVAEYHTNERSVWTLAFHPSNPNIIAFGTLGGKVFIYVNGKEEAWLDEREPIGSLCFHPVDNYLVLTSGNEVTFWDWKNDSTMNTLTYNDCKCRFLRITSNSMLITGISQTSLFASAGIGKNLPSVEPQYLMASFLRTVNFMLDSLEHGCTIGNSFNAELKKQFHFWNYLLKIIMDKRKELRCFATVKPDSKCTKSYLNNTLTILNRRIESILETVERIVFRLLPGSDGCVEQEYIEKFCRDPMLYFEQVCSNFVEQRYSGYIRYIFDLSLMKNMLYKIFKLFFDYGQKPPFEEWLKAEYYIDSSIISRNISQKNQFILQAWDVGDFRDTSTHLPDFKEDWKNVLSICSINNDSNVAISQCEQYIASVQSKAVHEMEVRSLSRANFGECMFVFRFTANFVSLSFSPSAKYIVIGLRCKKRMKFAYILDKDTRWKIGVDFRYDLSSSESRDADTSSPNERVGLKLCLPKESLNYKEINCIKWATLPGYGFFIGLKSKFIQICR